MGHIQIRQYGPRLAASVTLHGDEIATRAMGFRRLARYIFGENTSHASISMTAPVVQAPAPVAMTTPVAQSKTAAGTWIISFYMPPDYALANLPQPLDPTIVIAPQDASTAAVYRFSGSPDVAAVANGRTRLLQGLVGTAWVPVGQTVAWFYDPPWTLPWLRRNEVAVKVVRGR
jgi:hypothetical protein